MVFGQYRCLNCGQKLLPYPNQERHDGHTYWCRCSGKDLLISIGGGKSKIKYQFKKFKRGRKIKEGGLTMPVMTGKDTKGCYARWGGHGKKYRYTCGDKAGRDRAKAKAGKQGQAAHAAGYKGSENPFATGFKGAK